MHQPTFSSHMYFVISPCFDAAMSLQFLVATGYLSVAQSIHQVPVCQRL